MQTTKRRGRPRGKRRDESDSDEEYNAQRDEFNSVIDSAHQWILPAIRERSAFRQAGFHQGSTRRFVCNTDRYQVCMVSSRNGTRRNTNSNRNYQNNVY
jgi:hypothetical protein